MDATQTDLHYRGVLQGWGAGTTCEIGNELMMVLEVDTQNKIATVTRGFLSTAETHAINDLIFLQPRVHAADVLDLFNDCLEDLFGRELYKVGTSEVTYDPGAIGYAIPADAVEVLRVDALKDPSSGYWESIFDWFEVDNTDLSDFSTGRALMMRVSLPPGAFRVIYASPFVSLVTPADELDNHSGLRPYMFDLLFYFAMSRLMADLERSRSQMDTAQNHQRAQDTPPFLALRTGEWYQARYLDRIRIAQTHQAKEVRKARGTGYGS